ncbi:FAD:protein FMN transferase [Peijinzhouia sedimentorum]
MRPNQRKNIIYSLILVLAVFVVWKYRQNQEINKATTYVEYHGQTMGTIAYNVKYIDAGGKNLKVSTDSLLKAFNQSLSTYIPDSEISTFNQGTIFPFETSHFYKVLSASKEVYEATNGAFDPTVGPLVNAWGFGPEGRKTPLDEDIAAIKDKVGFDKIFFDSISVCKLHEGVYLDFSSIAKGYAVDLVAELLEANDIYNYLIDIGGELRAKGKNLENNTWRIAIEKPVQDNFSRESSAILVLEDKAIATSGDYRNYYEKDGKKIAHSINPKTGYPAEQNILSSTVVTENCMLADAYATAFMVLGYEASINVLKQHPEIQVFFIYADDSGEIKTFTSEGLNLEVVDENL